MNRHLVIFLFPLFLFGCPDSNKKKSEIFKTVQMGNPEMLFAGAETDADMWSQNYFKSGQKVWLNGMTSFESVQKYSPKSINLEKEQAADENPKEADGALEFIVKVHSPDVISMENSDKIGFRFIKVSSTDTIVELIKNGKTEGQAALIHFSMDSGKRAFTLLTYEKENGEKSVSYLQFRTKPLVNLELRPNTFYKFSSGPGVYARWKKHIDLNVCGRETGYIHDLAKPAVADWNRYLPANTQIKLSVARRYRPFSDLNQNCITLIDDFLTDPRKNVGNFGMTVTVGDLSELELFSSNMLFFRGEFEKTGASYRDPRLRDEFSYTVAHEIGHVLGLDHQFDDKIPSIMSYEYEARKATPYDIAAIRELYGN